MINDIIIYNMNINMRYIIYRNININKNIL